MVLTPTTPASLLFRLHDPRDHEAWLEFVSLYEPVIYRLLRRHGLQDADAREVMQDLFIAVNRSIKRWVPMREQQAFRGWLRRVARNLVINWLKQHRREARATGDSSLQAMLDSIPAEAEPETAEFDQELHRTLFDAAAQRVRGEVQPPTWEAFWQTAVAGASTAEIAERLGMTVGAVRVAKCRVLARIRAVLTSLETT